MKTKIHFVIISRSVLIKIRNVTDKRCGENQNTHFVFSKFFSLQNRAVYMIMCKTIVELDRPQMPIWRICVAGCIRKATNTNSEYVIIIAFPLQELLHEGAFILYYKFIAWYCLLMLKRIMWKFNLKRLTGINFNLEGCMMLCREIIAVCSQIHTKHINTVCGQNVQLLNVKLVVHIVTTGLQSVLNPINNIINLNSI